MVGPCGRGGGIRGAGEAAADGGGVVCRCSGWVSAVGDGPAELGAVAEHGRGWAGLDLDRHRGALGSPAPGLVADQLGEVEGDLLAARPALAEELQARQPRLQLAEHLRLADRQVRQEPAQQQVVRHEHLLRLVEPGLQRQDAGGVVDHLGVLKALALRPI